MSNTQFILLIIVTIVVAILSLWRQRINLKIYNSEQGVNHKHSDLFKQLINGSDGSVKPRTLLYWKVKPENKRLAMLNNIIAIFTMLYLLFLVIGIFWFDLI